jgi:predicted ester cyclase
MKGIDLVQRLHEIWNTGDLELIDSVYAPDFVAHWPASSEIPERRGIDGIRSGLARTRMAFPDWHERVLDVFGSAEMVASPYVSTGTHRGIYRGIEPTGRRVEIQEISIFRLAGDRVAEQWCIFDELAGSSNSRSASSARRVVDRMNLEKTRANFPTLIPRILRIARSCFPVSPCRLAR